MWVRKNIGYENFGSKKSFKLGSDLIDTNVLTKFHENLRINVLISALTRFHYIRIRKMPTSHLAAMFFKELKRFLKFSQDIVGKNYLTKKTALPLTAMVLSGRNHF
ncbi:hypothetical protein DPMN_005670 [Dreissena polymorpha]|uniref:Uncharacterized protein n=1 Tax=Dreissena polymorpha TaxID=45954 RepID=A0A9D4RWU3_DREPO|nr:hypothetical protein DPMN_005670 [Dreissena polymorpha]